jgi:hypothetical protein
MHVLETSSLQQQGEQLTPAGVQAQQNRKKDYSFVVYYFEYLSFVLIAVYRRRVPLGCWFDQSNPGPATLPTSLRHLNTHYCIYNIEDVIMHSVTVEI